MRMLRMRVAVLLALLALLAHIQSNLSAQTRSQPQAATGKVLALVGGRLIDGFGGKPLENSVILIEGERIKAIGQVGTLDPWPRMAWWVKDPALLQASA